MDYIRKTYVKFWGHKHNKTREVKTRDIKIKQSIRYRCFSFFDILSVVIDDNGKKVKLTSRRINVSPLHYLDGKANKVYTVTEFKRLYPSCNLGALRYLKLGRDDRVIRYANGNFYLVNKNNVVVLIT